ncbi:hypothetical protein, partial [Roseicella aerolata]
GSAAGAGNVFLAAATRQRAHGRSAGAYRTRRSCALFSSLLVGEPSAFTPDYAPEEMYEIAAKLTKAMR